VPPPLWSCEIVPFIFARCRLVSSVKISFYHIFTIWNSSSVIVCVSSLGHLSRPVLLPGFKHNAISWLVSFPLKRPGWWSAVQYVSISIFTIKGRMPISPLLCLRFVNCQHRWQKATNSRLFAQQSLEADWPVSCLYCLYLGRRQVAPSAVVSIVNPRLAPGNLE